LVLALAAVLPSASVVTLGGMRGRSFLGNGMQPEVVARTLSNVEEEWKAQAAVFAECNETGGADSSSLVNCQDAPASFGKSCSTVVTAIVQGSGGDRETAQEYMADVCSQPAISGWHQEECQALSLLVKGFMTADKYENRMNFKTQKVCEGFWSRVLDQEKARAAQEKAEREARLKKEAEEAAEQEKLRLEEAKKEEEKRRVEEAERQKEEARKQAEEAAEAAAQKKAEAEAVAEAAQQKMEEAKQAAEQHKKLTEAVNTTATDAAAPAQVLATVNGTNAGAVEDAAAPVAPASANSTVVAANTSAPVADEKAPPAPVVAAAPVSEGNGSTITNNTSSKGF